LITEKEKPIARLARTELKQLWPCTAGKAKGKIRIASDFDAPLEDFSEYTE
jgi:ArsR family metal-binding transcriptional regulator